MLYMSSCLNWCMYFCMYGLFEIESNVRAEQRANLFSRLCLIQRAERSLRCTFDLICNGHR